MDALTEILLRSSDSSEAISRIFEHIRKADRKFTLGYLCKKSGFASRGALSDIMNGKRRLNPKFKTVFADIFGLNPKQKVCFETLVELSAAKDVDQIRELKNSLQLSRKTFEFVDNDLWEGFESNDFFVVDMLGVFGLYADKPTRDNLIDFFGREYAVIIDETLGKLVARGVLGQDGPNHFINDKVLMLVTRRLSERSVFHRFIKKNFNLFLQSLAKNLDNPSYDYRAHSYYVSVKKAEFEAFMKRFTSEFEGHVANLVADDSDAIAHLGFFMHTVEPKISRK